MIEYLILVFLSTALAYLAKYKLKYGLELAFLLITIFAAIRYDFGNDYLNYLNEFEFHNLNSDMSSIADARTELGWFGLIFLFKDWGFFWLVAVLTIVEQLIMYYFIKKYVDKDVYWIAVFVYLISTQLFLSGLSMMRQSFSISICMIGFELSIKRKLVLSLAVVMIASLFHTSALLIIPFVLFLYFFYNRISISKSFSLILILVFVGISFLSSSMSLNSIMSLLAGSDIDKYSGYLSVDKVTKFGISTVVSYILMYIVFANYKCQNTNNQYFILLFAVGCFIESFAKSIYLVDRVALYFMCLTPICYSMAFKRIKKYSWYPIFIFLYIILKLYNYNTFISIGWGQTFKNYQTIFELY